MTAAFYNEIDPYAAQWTRNLIAAGHIAPGGVDERSIVELQPADVAGPGQRHFFSGIAGWSYALRLAGVADAANVWTGSCPCFAAGTLILTERGQIPIEQVVVGDRVVTHRGRLRAVTALMRSEKETLTVKGQGHCGLVTTDEHPFLTGPDQWTPAKNMQGKRWACVTQLPDANIPPLPPKAWKGRSQTPTMGPGFWRFVGYWLGDGWCRDRRQVVLCAARDEGQLLVDLAAGAGLSGSVSIERTSARLRIGTRRLACWLDDAFGRTATGKTIPTWLLSASREILEQFLSGLLEADGYAEQTGSGAKRLTTASRAIAFGIRIIANRLGHGASIEFHKPDRTCVIEGRTVRERGFFRVSIYKASRSFVLDENAGWGLVRSVARGPRMPVFNIAIAEDESYVADGIIVHNCQPFSGAGLKRGFDDERHLWPSWYRLIVECRPSIVFGEQTAGPAARAWLSAVRADLEDAGYAVGAADLPAAGVGAPHARARHYFVAYARGERRQDRIATRPTPGAAGGSGHLANTTSIGREQRGADQQGSERRGRPRSAYDRQSRELGHPDSSDLRWNPGAGDQPQNPSRDGAHSSWADAEWLACDDGKARAAQPGAFPLAHGVPDRVGKLRAYGNAIVPQQAAIFVRAALEAVDEHLLRQRTR